MRFWKTRIVPQTDSEKNNDWEENSHFLINLPREFESGTKKKRKTDLIKAVEYWTDKVNKIEENIKKTSNKS